MKLSLKMTWLPKSMRKEAAGKLYQLVDRFDAEDLAKAKQKAKEEVADFFRVERPVPPADLTL